MPDLTVAQQIRLEAAEMINRHGAIQDVREVLVLAKAIEDGEVSRLEDFKRKSE